MEENVLKIELRPLREDEVDIFVVENQRAFDKAVIEEYGPRERSVISRKDIERSLYGKGAEAFRIIADGTAVGGAVVAIAPQVSHVLQKYMNMFLGPLLILIAMLMLGLLKIPWSGGVEFNGRKQKYIEKYGIFSALPLGIVFALSFCPSSAVLYFGILLPLGIKTNSLFFLSGIFGIASAVPVIFFAFVIAFCSRGLTEIFDITSLLEFWATKITGIIFLFVGIYFTIIQLVG